MGKGMLSDWQRPGSGRGVGRGRWGGYTGRREGNWEGEAGRVYRKEGGGECEMAMGRGRKGGRQQGVEDWEGTTTTGE